MTALDTDSADDARRAAEERWDRAVADTIAQLAAEGPDATEEDRQWIGHLIDTWTPRIAPLIARRTGIDVPPPHVEHAIVLRRHEAVEKLLGDVWQRGDDPPDFVEPMLRELPDAVRSYGYVDGRDPASPMWVHAHRVITLPGYELGQVNQEFLSNLIRFLAHEKSHPHQVAAASADFSHFPGPGVRGGWEVEQWMLRRVPYGTWTAALEAHEGQSEQIAHEVLLDAARHGLVNRGAARATVDKQLIRAGHDRVRALAGERHRRAPYAFGVDRFQRMHHLGVVPPQAWFAMHAHPNLQVRPDDTPVTTVARTARDVCGLDVDVAELHARDRAFVARRDSYLARMEVTRHGSRSVRRRGARRLAAGRDPVTGKASFAGRTRRRGLSR